MDARRADRTEVDVALVGAGHNALVAAFYLARAGLRVELFEAKELVGGACKTEELIPGYRFSTCANVLAYLRPKVIRDMRLVERGLRTFGLQNHATLTGRGADQTAKIVPDGTSESIDRSVIDAWGAYWSQAAELLGPYLLSYPPSAAELRAHAARIGKADFLDDIVNRSLERIALERFGSRDLLDSILPPFDIGRLDDPRSSFMNAMSVAAMTYAEPGLSTMLGYVEGGMGRVTELMADAAREAGAQITLGAPVERIVVAEGQATGLELAGGAVVGSRVVVSGADIRRTFSRLLAGVPDLDDVRSSVAALSARVAPLKLHVALSGLPDFGRGVTDSIALNADRTTVEAAWEDSERGRPPTNPYMHVMIPSVQDPALAPPGHHTMSVWALYAPVTLAESSWPREREAMADRMLEIIARSSPDFASLVVDRFLLTPYDLEERVLLTGGQIHHVDLIPEQLLSHRPLPELARYRTPVSGLYLCGAGQHPYGEVTGAPGHNAAHAILEDLELVESGSIGVAHADAWVATAKRSAR